MLDLRIRLLIVFFLTLGTACFSKELGHIIPLLALFKMTNSTVFCWYSYEINKAKNGKSLFNKLIFWAHLCSWFGDLFMILEYITIFFVLSLSCFLMTHVLLLVGYINEFKNNYNNNKNFSILPTIMTTLMVGVYGLSTLSFFQRIIPKQLHIPCFTYMGAICSMVALSPCGEMIKIGNVFNKKMIFRVVGTFMFLISDSSLSIRLFMKQAPLLFRQSLVFVVMFTYFYAQFLITYSTVEDEKVKVEEKKKEEKSD